MLLPALAIVGLFLAAAGTPGTTPGNTLKIGPSAQIQGPRGIANLKSPIGNSSPPGATADADAPNIQAELLADQDALVPGATVRVGVRFKITPHWHIYWRNPGDAGLATRIAWKLPPGFTAGELRWALPQRFVDAGDIVTFGYTEELLLWCELKVPADAVVGATVTLQARAQWLACRSTCVPGEAPVELTLPVRPQARPIHQELFSAWAQRLPVEWTQAQPKATAKTEGGIPAGQTRGPLRLTIQWAQPVRQVEAFPAAANLLIENLRVVHKDAQAVVSLEVERLQVPGQPPVRLPMIVTYVDAQGVRRGLSVDLPLTPATDNKP